MFPVLVLGMTLPWSVRGSAQTYYKWTDQKGIVHLSDQVPSGVKGVQERVMVAPARPVDSAPSGQDAAAPGAPAAAATGGGPARVILESFQSPRTGPASMHVSGTVKNVGGTVADSIVVALSALDPGQGNPCFESDVSVSPSSLQPGEQAGFETDLNDPCLSGDAKLDAHPRWQGGSAGNQ